MHIIGTQQNFESEIKNSTSPVIVDFFADWCGPCQMLTPILEEIDKELGDKIKIIKINADSEPVLSSQLNVTALPTLLFYKNGQLINTLVGFRQKEDILAVLK
jgi:thioredoxin 1